LNPFAPLNHGKLGLGLIMDKEKTLDQKHWALMEDTTNDMLEENRGGVGSNESGKWDITHKR
jgi:hypothetical protein